MKTIAILFVSLLIGCSAAPNRRAAGIQSTEHHNWTVIRGILHDNAGNPLLSSQVSFTRKPDELGELTLFCLTDDKGLVHGEHGGDCRIPGNDLMQEELKAYTWWNVPAKGLDQHWFIMGSVLNPQALVSSKLPEAQD
jgi:hypothetical protein